MYPEFVGLYVCLGIVILLLLAVLAFLFVLLGKLRGVNGGKAAAPSAAGVVFCRSCQKQFPANQGICPHCGASRIHS